jgi:tripartite-type tricarboxylate transporter receptor subunit TctC
MSSILKQTVVVVNKPGGGGALGADYAAKARPDGYTVYVSTNSVLTISPHLKQLPYMPSDFTPIGAFAVDLGVITVRNTAPAKTLEEFVAYAKKNPGKLNYAEASASQRLSAEMFNKLAGVKIERVPYKASPQALGDVISGQCQLMFPDLPQGLAQIDAGKVRGLGTTGPQRTTVAPNLPAIAESVPGYSLVYWLAVFAPAGTPKDIQKTLADAVAEAMKDPATAKAMTQGRMEISPMPLDQFAAYVKEQTTWWTTEIKAAGIEPE